MDRYPISKKKIFSIIVFVLFLFFVQGTALIYAEVSLTPLNTDGFGVNRNFVIRFLWFFHNRLYALTYFDKKTDTGTIWFSEGKSDWQRLNLNDGDNVFIPVFVLFNDNLYLVQKRKNQTYETYEIWKSADGLSWDLSKKIQLTPSMRYLETFIYNDTILFFARDEKDKKLSLWKTEDGINWQQKDANCTALEFFSLGNFIYAWDTTEDGLQLWRSANGIAWHSIPLSLERKSTQQELEISDLCSINDKQYLGISYAPNGCYMIEVTDAIQAKTRSICAQGFGNKHYWKAIAAVFFQSYFYVSLESDNSTLYPPKIYRTKDFSTWEEVIADGFGNQLNQRIRLYMSPDELFIIAVCTNYFTGCQIWISVNGTEWSKLGENGFGFPANQQGRLWILNNELYITFDNHITGAQVWKISL